MIELAPNLIIASNGEVTYRGEKRGHIFYIETIWIREAWQRWLEK